MRVPGPSMTREHYDVLRRVVLEAVAAGDVELDCAEVVAVDSSALALVLAARRRAPSLHIKNVPDDLRALVRLYGLEQVFNELYA